MGAYAAEVLPAEIKRKILIIQMRNARPASASSSVRERQEPPVLIGKILPGSPKSTGDRPALLDPSMLFNRQHPHQHSPGKSDRYNVLTTAQPETNNVIYSLQKSISDGKRFFQWKSTRNHWEKALDPRTFPTCSLWDCAPSVPGVLCVMSLRHQLHLTPFHCPWRRTGCTPPEGTRTASYRDDASAPGSPSLLQHASEQLLQFDMQLVEGTQQGLLHRTGGQPVA